MLKILITALILFLLCLWLASAIRVEGADEIDWDRLVAAIIKVESNGNSNAIGSSGEIGLMQVSPIVLLEYNEVNDNYVYPIYYIPKGVDRLPYLEKLFRKLSLEQLYEPNINKYVGTWYLHRLKDHYLKENYTIERLLAAYNGGITRLRKVNYDVSKMPKSTRRYVKKVMALYKEK